MNVSCVVTFRKGMARNSLLPCLALALSGCFAGERPCDGFGHPTADAWTTAARLGDSVSFAGGTGGAMLTLISRLDSEPYTGTDPVSDESVVCSMRSNRRYAFGDGSTALSIEIRQSEGYGESLDEQQLSLDVRPESPPGKELGFGFLFSISHPAELYGPGRGESADGSRISTSTYLESFFAGGVRYAQGVEQRLTPAADVAGLAPDEASAIVRVVFADGGGLVEFERLDGTVFTRVGVDGN